MKYKLLWLLYFLFVITIIIFCVVITVLPNPNMLLAEITILILLGSNLFAANVMYSSGLHILRSHKNIKPVNPRTLIIVASIFVVFAIVNGTILWLYWETIFEAFTTISANKVIIVLCGIFCLFLFSTPLIGVLGGINFAVKGFTQMANAKNPITKNEVDDYIVTKVKLCEIIKFLLPLLIGTTETIFTILAYFK